MVPQYEKIQLKKPFSAPVQTGLTTAAATCTWRKDDEACYASCKHLNIENVAEVKYFTVPKSTSSPGSRAWRATAIIHATRRIILDFVSLESTLGLTHGRLYGNKQLKLRNISLWPKSTTLPGSRAWSVTVITHAPRRLIHEHQHRDQVHTKLSNRKELPMTYTITFYTYLLYTAWLRDLPLSQ